MDFLRIQLISGEEVTLSADDFVNLVERAWLFIRNRTEAAAKLSWSVKTLQVLTAFRWIQAQFRLEELQAHSSTFVGWGWGKVHSALVCFKRLISRVEKR